VNNCDSLKDARTLWYHDSDIISSHKVFDHNEAVYWNGIQVNIGKDIKVDNQLAPEGVKIVKAKGTWKKDDWVYTKEDGYWSRLAWEDSEAYLIVEKGNRFPSKLVGEFLDENNEINSLYLLYLGDEPEKGRKYFESTINLSHLNAYSFEEFKKRNKKNRVKKVRGAKQIESFSTIKKGMWVPTEDLISNLSGYYLTSHHKSVEINNKLVRFNENTGLIEGFCGLLKINQIYAFPKRLQDQVDKNKQLKPLIPAVIDKEKKINVNKLKVKLIESNPYESSVETVLSYLWSVIKKDDDSYHTFKKYMIDIIGEAHVFSRWLKLSLELCDNKSTLTERDIELIRYIEMYAISIDKKMSRKNGSKLNYNPKLNSMAKTIKKRYDFHKFNCYSLRYDFSKEAILAMAEHILGKDIVRKRVKKITDTTD